MPSRLTVLSWGLAVVSLVLGVAIAGPSNKWRIQVSSDADSDGVVVFHIAPVAASEPPVDVTVQIPKNAGENHIAQLIRDSMRAQLGDRYRVEVDDGEDVLLKKHLGDSNFDLQILQKTVKGVRITLDKE